MNLQDESSAPPPLGAEQGRNTADSSASDSLEALARLWPADAMQGFAQLLGGASTDGAGAFSLDGDAGRAAMLLMQGYALWANQGMRYWSRLADMHASHFQGLLERARRMRDNPEASVEERNAMVDEAQRYLREVADLSYREGRLLRQALERLSAELRSEMTPADPQATPRRYAKAKP